MRLSIVIIAVMAIAVSPWSPARAANVPSWCASSGYDNGPARESRGPGNGPSWQGEPAIASRSGEGAAIAEPIPIRSSGSS